MLSILFLLLLSRSLLLQQLSWLWFRVLHFLLLFLLPLEGVIIEAVLVWRYVR